ncbi:MAG: Omp28-related outer membrane protein [Prevotella sp.]|nr:Omp28-related outer membrane protein [Prevotella sp.]
MKKFLLLFWMTLTGILSGFGQSTNAIVFVDANGTVLEDGATLTINTPTKDDFGDDILLSGLSIKNVSDEAVSASIHVNIKSISNGKLQICFPTACITKEEACTFVTNGVELAAGAVRDLQTEWVPAEDGTCLVTYQIELMKQTVEFPTEFESVGMGSTVTIKYVYGKGGEVNPDPEETSQYYCGLYTTDELSEDSYGMGRYCTGVCKAATVFDYNVYNSFIGFKVVGMRVGLKEDVTDFSVFTSLTKGSSIVDFISQDAKTGEEGWNTIMFDEENQFELTDDGTEYIVGFTYNQVANGWPISYYENAENKGMFLFYGNIPSSYGGNGAGWYNLGEDGALSVQWIVEGELTGQRIALDGLAVHHQFFQLGTDVEATVKVSNKGKEAIKNLGFNYYIDDEKCKEETVNVSLASMESAKLPVNISLPTDYPTGQHTLKVELVTVNGAAPADEVDNNNQTTTFTAYKESKTRQKQLVEHITSWTCTYCHLGYKLLREMEKQYDDIAWVSIHGNQSSQQDPYYFSTVDNILSMVNANSFPTAAFNRTYIPDLADGEELAVGLGYDTDNYLQQIVSYIRGYIDQTNVDPAFVSLDIEQEYNADKRDLTITVKGTGAAGAATMLKGSAITIYLTEGGLKGRQYSNGKWENNFEHNNVLRAVLTNYHGDLITWDGDNFEYTTNYTIPDNYDVDNLSITAFVAPLVNNTTDIYHMAVNNCEKVAVNTTTTSVKQVSEINQVRISERYNIDGQRLNTPQKGINLIKMTDGSVRKVVVK